MSFVRSRFFFQPDGRTGSTRNEGSQGLNALLQAASVLVPRRRVPQTRACSRCWY